MKVSWLICLFSLISCEVIPPGTSSDSRGEVEVRARNVLVKCSELDSCSSSEKMIARYYSDSCKNIDLSSKIIAQAKKENNCQGDVCYSLLNKFSLDGEEILVEEGLYSLEVFLDLNQNESVDIGEPYFCANELELTKQKQIINIEITIIREFE